jgi:hypothetical protein
MQQHLPMHLLVRQLLMHTIHACKDYKNQLKQNYQRNLYRQRLQHPGRIQKLKDSFYIPFQDMDK